jgi:hypothetical protein
MNKCKYIAAIRMVLTVQTLQIVVVISYIQLKQEVILYISKIL